MSNSAPGGVAKTQDQKMQDYTAIVLSLICTKISRRTRKFSFHDVEVPECEGPFNAKIFLEHDPTFF